MIFIHEEYPDTETTATSKWTAMQLFVHVDNQGIKCYSYSSERLLDYKTSKSGLAEYRSFKPSVEDNYSTGEP